MYTWFPVEFTVLTKLELQSLAKNMFEESITLRRNVSSSSSILILLIGDSFTAQLKLLSFIIFSFHGAFIPPLPW